ncbi:hypothetical protein BARVI_08920 [Barnesiella viscericola DSM 18177]|uniref:Uncharacterized protein n=1 Tax=Barnesiella viscericola DSM 18177 TaxID=880074 RepID=W0EXE7_9BACT|nr:hypothetical protein BARVI_08920 [Barnesiella viscericola DSM 18177]
MVKDSALARFETGSVDGQPLLAGSNLTREVNAAHRVIPRIAGEKRVSCLARDPIGFGNDGRERIGRLVEKSHLAEPLAIVGLAECRKGEVDAVAAGYDGYSTDSRGISIVLAAHTTGKVPGTVGHHRVVVRLVGPGQFQRHHQSPTGIAEAALQRQPDSLGEEAGLHVRVANVDHRDDAGNRVCTTLQRIHLGKERRPVGPIEFNHVLLLVQEGRHRHGIARQLRVKETRHTGNAAKKQYYEST